MTNYLRAECYRLLHKRSGLIYFAVLAVAYILLAFVRADGLTENSVLWDAEQLYVYLPALAGGFLFAAIYTDDLNSKNLTSLVGYGLDKGTIALSKFILMMVLNGGIYLCVVLLTYLSHAALGAPVSLDTLPTVAALAFSYWLQTLAYAALATILVYGLQRPTFAIVLYLLLALGIIDSLLTAILTTDFVSSLLPGLQDLLIGALSREVTYGLILPQDSFALPLVGLIIWMAVGLVLSIVAFKNKEMEF